MVYKYKFFTFPFHFFIFLSISLLTRSAKDSLFSTSFEVFCFQIIRPNQLVHPKTSIPQQHHMYLILLNLKICVKLLDFYYALLDGAAVSKREIDVATLGQVVQSIGLHNQRRQRN
ncbi:non-specific serine/threonine protein kinase [Trifolium repens]|nr:non-specific serine/threonine protein kinase [Trifolium repens]